MKSQLTMTRSGSMRRSGGLSWLGSCLTDPHSDRLLTLMHEKNWDMTLKLIRRGEGLRWKSFGWTVLHFAMWKMVPERIVLALLQSGLSANEPDNEDGKTALHFAVQFHPSSVQALVKHAANANSEDHSGVTPLAVAAAKGQPETLQQLIDAGGSVNSSSHDGTTPLMMAAISPTGTDCVRVLLKNGAERWAVDENGLTALARVRQLANPCQGTIALLDPKTEVLVALCSLQRGSIRNQCKTRAPIEYLPIELIRKLSEMF